MNTEAIFEASKTETPFLWAYHNVVAACESHGQDPSEFYRDCERVGCFFNRPGNVDAAEVLTWLGY